MKFYQLDSNLRKFYFEINQLNAMHSNFCSQYWVNFAGISIFFWQMRIILCTLKFDFVCIIWIRLSPFYINYNWNWAFDLTSVSGEPHVNHHHQQVASISAYQHQPSVRESSLLSTFVFGCERVPDFTQSSPTHSH